MIYLMLAITVPIVILSILFLPVPNQEQEDLLNEEHEYF
jgi:hypothetical protein